MENLSVEIDPLGSDALARVNTIVELDDKRPNIALLAIDDELTASRGVRGHLDNGRGGEFPQGYSKRARHSGCRHTPCLSIHDTILHTTNGTSLSDGWLHTRSFVLYSGSSEDQWDYLTQQPSDAATLNEKPRAEFTWHRDGHIVEFRVSAYLSGALATYFGKWWGGESADSDDDRFQRGPEDT
ncbi:hypothetical protein ARMGADRAFT_1073691 [Armillaria gallica]|uniref:Uncharacterized protein n=1 Tax=Armillaria gallica TaxID=47427 RepID=A0A2H3E1S1_ARMGA|nr:hypothetical protein ARMGADRAFT_1073691 [Armillaria gallica]